MKDKYGIPHKIFIPVIKYGDGRPADPSIMWQIKPQHGDSIEANVEFTNLKSVWHDGNELAKVPVRTLVLIRESDGRINCGAVGLTPRRHVMGFNGVAVFEEWIHSFALVSDLTVPFDYTDYTEHQ